MSVKRRARALARRVAVEALARVDGPHPDAAPVGDVVLLLHHVPAPALPRLEAVVAMVAGFAVPTRYSEICAGPAEGSGRRFAVTFDDGNRSQLEAAERLEAMGVPACFFIIADALDADAAETERLCRDQLWMAPTPFMSRTDLDRLIELGHEIGSHTRGHLDLTALSDQALVDQVAGSKQALAPWLDEAAHFAWPFGGPGHFDRRAYDAVAAAGYASCASGLRGIGTWRPSGDGPPLVFRQSINLGDSLAVQRRFVLNGERQRGASLDALRHLN